MRKKLPHVTRPLLGFFTPALALLLFACGTAGTGSVTISPATAVPTSLPAHGMSTPSMTPSTNATPSMPTQPLIGIRMLDIRNGWALTVSSILKTSDGGLQWPDR